MLWMGTWVHPYTVPPVHCAGVGGFWGNQGRGEVQVMLEGHG